MKKSKRATAQKTYKKEKKEMRANVSFIFSLFILFSFLLLAKNFSSIVKPVEFKKVFAKAQTKEEPFVLPVVRVLSIAQQNEIDASSDSFPTLMNITTLISPTATPTPEPKKILQTPPSHDFCLNVPILMYHHVQPIAEAQALGHAQLTVDNQVFDEQINYLASNGYHFISSEEVVAALRNHQPLPEKSIVVTLDDGYDDAYNYAFPIAKKYNIPLDFMIPSGLINNSGYMTWEQLKEAANSNLIHVYNHTWSHAALGGASEEQIQKEIMTANNQLEATLGKKINIFVYPYGSFGDASINFLKTHGFVGALSTIDGKVQCESYIMTLHRTRIGNTTLSYYGF